ncbi:uncharacterized protein HGUI_01663 [Hanseniaspora guilliermondii]|uniref:Reduced meiotic recombination protein 1 n=1 Tax=Hanseniaspora guilliermondii TaxID=56406 RepID=A0A1L0CXA8_9ASCO|nr:uncharacterized protein HGUI_01663 [Hanseniaspora guilliermondii]
MEKEVSDNIKRPRMTISPLNGKLELTDDHVNDPYIDGSARPFNSLDQVIKKQKQNEKKKSVSGEFAFSNLLSSNQLANGNGEAHYNDINLDDEESSEDSNSILVGSRSVPKVMIKFKKGKYGMYANVPVQRGCEATLQHFTDKVEKSFENMDVIFSTIKKSLLQFTPSSELANNEMIVYVKELDLTLEEDNKYNKNITLQDLCSIYRSLSENTKTLNDEYTEILTFEVSTKKRFLNRYNELVELVDNRGNLTHIKKFSNDSGHPVVLDDENDDNSIDKRIINITGSPGDEDEVVVID